MSSVAGFTLLDSEPGEFYFFRWKNLRITVWQRQATGPAVERLQGITQKLIESFPNGISNVHLAGAGPPRPSSAPPRVPSIAPADSAAGTPRPAARSTPPTTAALPTNEARERLKGLMDNYGSQIACVAVIIVGSGFWASTLRSVITGMHLESSRTFPMRLCDSVQAAVQWLPSEHLRLTGVRLEPRDLGEVLHRAREFLF
jgi:hypothetical protein